MQDAWNKFKNVEIFFDGYSSDFDNIYDDNDKKQVISINQASGFQQFAISLALRISLYLNKKDIKIEYLELGVLRKKYLTPLGLINRLVTNLKAIKFLSKYIGNYNITKISDTFIFENRGWAVALTRK